MRQDGMLTALSCVPANQSHFNSAAIRSLGMPLCLEYSALILHHWTLHQIAHLYRLFSFYPHKCIFTTFV